MHPILLGIDGWRDDVPAALEKAFIKADRKFLDKLEDSGSTCNVVVLNPEHHAWIANLG